MASGFFRLLALRLFKIEGSKVNPDRAEDLFTLLIGIQTNDKAVIRNVSFS